MRGSERRWLAAIAEAARTAARDESKTRWLLRFLRRVREPVIVFTEYRDTLARLQKRIAATGRSLAVLHGGLDPRERAAIAAALDARVATLLATDAAAEGLNLQHHSRIVVHYELPWNPARLEQRAGRVDRHRADTARPRDRAGRRRHRPSGSYCGRSPGARRWPGRHLTPGGRCWR